MEMTLAWKEFRRNENPAVAAASLNRKLANKQQNMEQERARVASAQAENAQAENEQAHTKQAQAAEQVATREVTKPVSKEVARQTAKVLSLTGQATRVVWCQSLKGPKDYCATGKSTQLWGFSTEDGRGERLIRGDVTSYAKPIFTPDGQRVVYSDRSNNKIYIVNWDGSDHREIGQWLCVGRVAWTLSINVTGSTFERVMARPAAA